MAEEFKAKGNKALQERRYDEAVVEYTKAIELAPDNEVLYSNRSAAYLSKGDASAALSDAQKCVELKPTWAKGHGRVAAAHHKAGDYDAAIQAYEVRRAFSFFLCLLVLSSALASQRSHSPPHPTPPHPTPLPHPPTPHRAA